VDFLRGGLSAPFSVKSMTEAVGNSMIIAIELTKMTVYVYLYTCGSGDGPLCHSIIRHFTRE